HAYAFERPLIHRLVLGHIRTDGRRPFFLPCTVPFRPLDSRHLRAAEARRDARSYRRGPGKATHAARGGDRTAAHFDVVFHALHPSSAGRIWPARRARLPVSPDRQL